MSNSEWRKWKIFLTEQGFDVKNATANKDNHWQYRCFSVGCPYLYRNGGVHTKPTEDMRAEAKKQINKCRLWKAKEDGRTAVAAEPITTFQHPTSSKRRKIDRGQQWLVDTEVFIYHLASHII